MASEFEVSILFFMLFGIEFHCILSDRYPIGHYVRTLGPLGDKQTENEVLLIEHDVPHSKFSEEVLRCLPIMPWRISDQVCVIVFRTIIRNIFRYNISSCGIIILVNLSMTANPITFTRTKFENLKPKLTDFSKFTQKRNNSIGTDISARSSS